MTNRLGLVLAGAAVFAAATPATAQQAGDIFVRVADSRTKLADHGELQLGGATVPGGRYHSRQSFHGTVTGGVYVLDRVAVEASVSTPQTYDFDPRGTLAGTPNLANQEVVTATIGGSLHPFKGAVSPYVGGGLQGQFTTQRRDALAADFRLRNAYGPYVHAGIDIAMPGGWSLFADARKAFYDARVSGQLPLDATYTRFVPVGADAHMDPVTLQLGVAARFGAGSRDAAAAIGTDTTKWTIRAGITTLELADKVDLNVGGAPYPGASLATNEHQTVSLQIGRFLTSNIAVAATVGFPPTIDIHGGGSIGGLPRLGRATYGPVVGTVQYHLTRSGRVRPYVGAGAAYMIVFSTKGGAFENLRINNDLAPAVEGGTDIMVSNHFGLFVDAKKAFLRPMTFGNYEGLTVSGKTRLDAWAFSGGAAFHF